MTAGDSARAEVLITAADLNAALQSEDPPAVLDVRWALGDPNGYRDHLEAHIPGARFVDLDGELSAPPTPRDGRHPLPRIDDLQRAARGWGIRRGQPVVVYDATGAQAAARAWWVLRWAGVPDVRILDGGLPAWLRAGFDTATATPSTTAPADQADATDGLGTADELGTADGLGNGNRPGDVELSPGHLPVLDADGAARLARTGTLLDARADARYRGEVEPIDPRAGHIPGSVSAPTAENLDGDAMFRPTAELRQRFESVGSLANVGVYCGSGVSAAHEIAALAVMGVPAALYPGSWSQWSADPSRAAATGAEPG